MLVLISYVHWKKDIIMTKKVLTFKLKYNEKEKQNLNLPINSNGNFFNSYQ